MDSLLEACCTGCLQCCNSCASSGLCTSCALYGFPDCNCGNNKKPAATVHKYNPLQQEIPSTIEMNRDIPLKF